MGICLGAVMLTGFPLRRNPIATGLKTALTHPAGIARRPEFLARDFFTIFCFRGLPRFRFTGRFHENGSRTIQGRI
jgi:hypothetical protein